MQSKIEDTIINQTIVEYFEAYVNPFEGFTDEERQKMKDTPSQRQDQRQV